MYRGKWNGSGIQCSCKYVNWKINTKRISAKGKFGRFRSSKWQEPSHLTFDRDEKKKGRGSNFAGPTHVFSVYFLLPISISISKLYSISITKYPQCRIQRSLMKQVRDEVHPKTLFATCICTVHCKCQNFFSLFKNFSHFRPEDRIFCLNIQEMINNGVAVTIPLTFYFM